uniref:Uncharacterized protein n=1 Tax=Tanacetum cinerariifolium TaxID=118510 RepID=A0A6L2JM96_TANCI|nr:hypothetical protein [Tanacetum cinerariifolium]
MIRLDPYFREITKVQTLFKPDKDVEEPKKKRVVDETLLQESFKKLKAVEVSGSESTQEIPSNDLKEMTEKDVQYMLDIVPLKIMLFKDLRKMHKGINAAGSSITAVGSTLMLLDKVDTAAEVLKNLL